MSLAAMRCRRSMLHLVVLLLVCFLRCGSSERATRPDTDPLHVLLIPGPSEMSSRPLVGLAKELHDRGHEVSIAVLQHVQDEVIQLSSEVFGASPLGVSLEGVQDLNFLSIPVYNAELLWTWDDFRGSPDLYNRELMTMEDLVVRHLKPIFSDEVRISVGAPVMPLDCIVADHLMWGGFDLADDLGIPCIANSAGTFQNPFRGSFGQPEFKLTAPIDITTTKARLQVYFWNWTQKLSWCYRYLASNMIRKSFDIDAYPSPDRAFAFHRVTMVNVPVGVEPVKRLVHSQVQRLGHERHLASPVSSDIETWLEEDSSRPVLFVSLATHRQAAFNADAFDETVALSVASFTPKEYRVLWNNGPKGISAGVIEEIIDHEVKVVSLNTTTEELDVIFDPRVDVLLSDGRTLPLKAAAESATPVLCAPCCDPEYIHNCVSSAMAKGSLLVTRVFSQAHFSLLDRLNLHDNQVHALHIGDSGDAAELVERVTRVGEHHFLPLDSLHLHWLFQQTFFDVWFVLFFFIMVAVWFLYASVRAAVAFAHYVWPIFLEALSEPLEETKTKTE